MEAISLMALGFVAAGALRKFYRLTVAPPTQDRSDLHCDLPRSSAPSA